MLPLIFQLQGFISLNVFFFCFDSFIHFCNITLLIYQGVTLVRYFRYFYIFNLMGNFPSVTFFRSSTGLYEHTVKLYTKYTPFKIPHSPGYLTSSFGPRAITTSSKQSRCQTKVTQSSYHSAEVLLFPEPQNAHTMNREQSSLWIRHRYVIYLI